MAVRLSRKWGRRPGPEGPDATVDWRRAARQLETEVERVVALLRDVRNPSAPALGQWSVAEVAMHLSQAWMAVPGLARRDLSEVRAAVPSVGDGPSLIHDIWGLGDLTVEGVEADSERDPRVLAERIEARASAYLASLDGSPSERRPWLVAGTEATLVTLTCHLLNETVVHGRDIAVGDGRPWEVSPGPAATILDGFVFPILGKVGQDLVDQEVAAGVRATYEVRVRGGGRHLLVFDDGAFSVEPPSDRPVDCVVTADPAAMLLVVWGRMDQAKAIVERRLVPSGPKPELAPRLRSLLRNP